MAATALGFFAGRRKVRYGVRRPSNVAGLVEYANVPAIVGTIVSSGKATLHELQTVYGVQDAYDLLEVINVDLYNERVAREANTPRG